MIDKGVDDFLHNQLIIVANIGDSMIEHITNHIRFQPFPSICNTVKIWAICVQVNSKRQQHLEGYFYAGDSI
ncbi:hypothetical protein EBB07_24265 [Paenibacillaceae bacterium]|nr:hypothetical protein EBB07_24265 [Paenibacillaceae bacterium]